MHSLDYDPNMVEATRTGSRARVRRRIGKLEHGSILDKDYVRFARPVDIVDRGRALHHTGATWEAVENCASSWCASSAPAHSDRVVCKGAAGGIRRILLSRSAITPLQSSGKRWMVARWIVRGNAAAPRARGQNPFTW